MNTDFIHGFRIESVNEIRVHLWLNSYSYGLKSYVRVPATLTVIPSLVVGANVASRAAASAASRSGSGPSVA